MDVNAVIAQPPVDMQAPETAMWLFTFFVFAVALGGIVWAVVRWRRGDRILAVLLGSSLIVSVNEPMVDHLGHLWYPTNLPWELYTAFGVHIPALVPPAYAFFGGVSAYVAYIYMRRGTPVRGLMMVWAVLALDDLLLEYPGVATGVYTYFGDQPFELFGYPWWWCPLAGCAMFVPAYMLYWLEPRLHGSWRALLLLVMPMGVLFTYSALAWPVFLALNTDVPEPVRWIAAVGSTGLCVITALCIARIVGTDGPWRAHTDVSRAVPTPAAATRERALA